MSHSRKHLTNATLNEFPFPTSEETICRVVRLLGNNTLEVLCPKGEKLIVSIPQKFNKVVWIGKGDYLIVDLVKNYSTSDKRHGLVHHVLYKEQIKHLQTISLWPPEFSEGDLFKEKSFPASHNQLGDFDITDSEEDELADDRGNSLHFEKNSFVNPNHVGVAESEDEEEWSC